MAANYLNLLRSFLFILIFSPLTPSFAYANSTYDIAWSLGGEKLLSRSGNCVRTGWDVGIDRCVDTIPPVTIVEEISVLVEVGIEERTVHFDFDSAKLSKEAKAKLDSLVKVLKEHNIQSVKIFGFTDRIGAKDYNHKLSVKRADAVKKYLESKVAINSNILVEKGYGKKDQIKPCDGAKSKKELIKCLRPNRRVVVEIDYTGQY